MTANPSVSLLAPAAMLVAGLGGTIGADSQQDESVAPPAMIDVPLTTYIPSRRDDGVARRELQWVSVAELTIGRPPRAPRVEYTPRPASAPAENRATA